VTDPADRAAVLARAVRQRRLVGAGREHAAYEQFCAERRVSPSPEAVTLYLTHLLDTGTAHGRGLRYRLQLLDLHARLSGAPVPSADRDLRRYLRGLHREASLATPEKGVDPLHAETLCAALDAVVRPLPQQVRDVALLLLADASGLPDAVLVALRWDQIRFRPSAVVVTVPGTPARGRRGWSPLTVPANDGPTCPRRALLAWRHAAGPAQQPVFGIDGAAALMDNARAVLRLLGPPPRPADIGRPRTHPEQLTDLAHGLLAPRPRAVRDTALLLIAWTAALGTDDARKLRQCDVRREARGLLLRVPGRAQPWTAVPASRGTAPCPASAWDRWRDLLSDQGLADDRLPAFTQIAGTVVKPGRIGEQGLNQLVQQDCARAGLRGEYSFTSLRSGFIRTAVRSGAPEHVVARQAGLAALHSVGTHARREMLVRENVARLVGL
jgi:integrase